MNRFKLLPIFVLKIDFLPCSSLLTLLLLVKSAIAFILCSEILVVFLFSMLLTESYDLKSFERTPCLPYYYYSKVQLFLFYALKFSSFFYFQCY